MRWMASQETPSLEPEGILVAVSQLGIGGNLAFLDGEFSGGEYRVFKLSFKDEASMAGRVPHPTDNSNHNDTTTTL